jgi:LmbE family N-acetylglucosaminyl deacetylase
MCTLCTEVERSSRYNELMRRMLCVTAHPDDEAGGFGGSLALYHDRGIETSVICLTPGQAATHRGAAKDDHELAALRREEFAASCRILKITHGLVLDYPDGDLYRQDLYRVVYDLAFEVRRFRPQVMLSFGPEGGVTGHTDHSMASVFAELAFHWAGRSNRYPDQLRNGITPHRTQKLYYATADFTLPDRQPVTLAPANAVIDIGQHLETKIAAFKVHQTQAPLWSMFESHVRQRGSKEMFHLAAAMKAKAISRETDLFQEVEETG